MARHHSAAMRHNSPASSQQHGVGTPLQLSQSDSTGSPSSDGGIGEDMAVLPFACSAFRCWSKSRQIGTEFAIVVISFRILGVLWWGFCCVLRLRVLKERPQRQDEEGGSRKKRAGNLGALLGTLMSWKKRSKKKGQQPKRRRRRSTNIRGARASYYREFPA